VGDRKDILQKVKLKKGVMYAFKNKEFAYVKESENEVLVLNTDWSIKYTALMSQS
jgi:hypothetical protein